VLAYAGEAMLHAAVAAVVAETLLRVWRAKHADERLGLRMVVLVLPLLLPVVFAIAAPFRHYDWFTTNWALFAGEHWNQIRVAGIGAWSIAVGVLGLVGVVLCMRDLVGFLIDRVRRGPHLEDPRSEQAIAFRQLVAGLAATLGVTMPDITMLAIASPVLLCAGVMRPTLVVSLGTLDRLDPEELRAGLTHELAHVASRDTRTGWTLMGLRLLQAFNPVSQIVGRQAVQEIERRADARVAAAGQHAALARALIKLSGSRDGEQRDRPSERLGLTRRLAARAAIAELDRRCDHLLDGAAGESPGLSPVRVALAAAGLAALLFFVV
jgi:Zn-dependent protease with chaperone function